jgi:hypothetical protein
VTSETTLKNKSYAKVSKGDEEKERKGKNISKGEKIAR